MLEIGPDLFRAACRMGLEGLVSNIEIGLIAAAAKVLGQSQESRPPRWSASFDAPTRWSGRIESGGTNGARTSR
jgi:hypothetical protein